MKLVIAFILITFLISCNGAKRIQRVKAQFDEIGRDWAQSHPCPPSIAKSDTVYSTDSTEYNKYIEVISNLSEGSDLQTEAQLSAERELYLKDERYRAMIDSFIRHPITVTRIIKIHDSIPDTRALEACKEESNRKDITIAAKDGQIAAENKSRRNWLITSLSLMAAILLFLGIKISSFFSPKLPKI